MVFGSSMSNEYAIDFTTKPLPIPPIINPVNIATDVTSSSIKVFCFVFVKCFALLRPVEKSFLTKENSEGLLINTLSGLFWSEIAALVHDGDDLLQKSKSGKRCLVNIVLKLHTDIGII